jgi:hypothetical protein
MSSVTLQCSVLCYVSLKKNCINYFSLIYRIAFGVGDGTIRVWNLSNSTSLEVTLLWQKIKGKVMAVSMFIFLF